MLARVALSNSNRAMDHIKMVVVVVVVAPATNNSPHIDSQLNQARAPRGIHDSDRVTTRPVEKNIKS